MDMPAVTRFEADLRQSLTGCFEGDSIAVLRELECFGDPNSVSAQSGTGVSGASPDNTFPRYNRLGGPGRE